MKSTQILSRVINRRGLTNLAKNACALTSGESTRSASSSSSHQTPLQLRNLGTAKLNPKRATAEPSASRQATEKELERNVLASKFEEIPLCNVPFHRKVLLKIVEHAAMHPSRAALMLADDPSVCISYSDLHKQTYALASFLSNSGFGHLSVCCSVLPSCIEFVPSYLGTMMVGGVSMCADENCIKDELERAFTTSQCRATITSFALLSKVMAAAKSCPFIKTIICVTSSADQLLPEGVVNWEDVMQTHTVQFQKYKYSGNNAAFIQYQSGVPESRNGIVMSHSNISTMLDVNSKYFTDYVYKRMFFDNKEGKYEPCDEHAILSMPFNHIFGFAHLNRILLEGSTGIIATKSNTVQLLEMLQKYRPKVVHMLPETATAFVEDPIVDNYDIKSLEVVLIGGAPFSSSLMDTFLRKFNHVRFMIPFYGWPECGVGFVSPMRVRHGTATILPTFHQKVIDPINGVALPASTEAAPGISLLLSIATAGSILATLG
ncbi:unnamed protein product [Cylicocyclus nassatus]|uniref:AMP-dependent synthetase/ligase domain-containing protein n=1 Tax=Cylicocyclus nassatus TaxID=53992 RepID=A0AA36H943_CYLNA|nr:unnamed protein product [Cylicocyclus nassatus]